ncbi:MAG: hypothetical protein KY476_19465 [Planctomycetes bacterium]|nr:hypothetical protein [Planctomycetota bacterium]
MANPENLKAVRREKAPGIVFDLARVPQSGRVYFGGSDARVYEADFASEKIEPKEVHGEHASYVMGVALVGNRLISGGWDRRLVWWDVEAGKLIRSVDDAHTLWIRGVAATPDGLSVLSIADDMVLRVWDAETGDLKHELRGHEELTPHHYHSMLHAVAVSADGKLAATGDKVGHVCIWDIEAGKQVGTVESPENYTWDPRQRRHSAGGLRGLAFSPDGKLLAVGGIAEIGNIDGLGASALIQIYDWQNKGQRVHRFAHEKHKGLVEHVAFSHDGKWLLAAGGAGGGFLLFMDPESGKFTRDEDAKMHVHAFALDESSETIYAVGHEKLAVWEMKS